MLLILIFCRSGNNMICSILSCHSLFIERTYDQFNDI